MYDGLIGASGVAATLQPHLMLFAPRIGGIFILEADS